MGMGMGMAQMTIVGLWTMREAVRPTSPLLWVGQRLR